MNLLGANFWLSSLWTQRTACWPFAGESGSREHQLPISLRCPGMLQRLNGCATLCRVEQLKRLSVAESLRLEEAKCSPPRRT
uniref:Secreted protein n=1 Tax=Globodera rostochiensis TaxID=31243 RepID=A0A914IBA7_GLORO